MNRCRVNRQLKELNGPLLSLTSSSDASWKQFRNTYRNFIKSNFNSQNPPSEKEKEIWRTWILTIFHPINKEIYIMVLRNGDLIIEDKFPIPLKDLYAHNESNKSVTNQWNQGNYEEHLSLLDYPPELINYAEVSFQHLIKTTIKTNQLISLKLKKAQWELFFKYL